MLKTEIIKGQKSWIIENGSTRVCITEFGGHMAPVTFMKDTADPIEPFYINPWAEEDPDMSGQPGVLKSLRGDFFCLPFGGNNSWNGETHAPHGEVNEKNWNFVKEEKADDGSLTTVFDLETSQRPGRVVKTVTLKDGDNAVYLTHRIEGFAGPAPLGHHAIFSGGSPKYISTSPMKFGITDNNSTGGYSGGEYYSLDCYKKFDSLDKVPTIWKDKPYTDCSVFPAREGFIDILQICNEPMDDFAWSAVACPEEGWLWFSLKDSDVLNSTTFWMENRGRHGLPWNGRNSCIGVEDVCTHLADGLSVAAEENGLTKEGVKTCHILKNDTPFDVKYVHAVVPIPADFDRAASIEKAPGGVLIKSFSGVTVEVRVDTSFIKA